MLTNVNDRVHVHSLLKNQLYGSRQLSLRYLSTNRRHTYKVKNNHLLFIKLFTSKDL